MRIGQDRGTNRTSPSRVIISEEANYCAPVNLINESGVQVGDRVSEGQGFWPEQTHPRKGNIKMKSKEKMWCAL